MPSRARHVGLIVTVGGQSEQIDFQMAKLRPTHVAFLATCTQECLQQVDSLVRSRGLPAQCHKTWETDDAPECMGRVVDNTFEAYHWLTTYRGVPAAQVHLDPTGGRKWMSAAATLAGAELGLAVDYVHVDTRTDVDEVTGHTRSVPDPSTMRVVPLGDAFELIRLPRLNAGIERYNACDYVGAQRAFEEIRDRASGSALLQSLADGLAQAASLAAALDGFAQFDRDLSEAFSKTVRALRDLAGERPHLGCLSEVADGFERLGRAFPAQWEQKPQCELGAALVLAARRWERRQLFDMAVLCYYRCLELAAQVWLAEFDGFDTANPDWSKLPEKAVTAFRRQYREKRQIDLVAGYVLLRILEHPMVSEGDRVCVRWRAKEDRWVPDFEGVLATRNHLVAEHGFRPASSKDARSMAHYALPIAERLCGKGADEMERDYGIPAIPRIGDAPAT